MVLSRARRIFLLGVGFLGLSIVFGLFGNWSGHLIGDEKAAASFALFLVALGIILIAAIIKIRDMPKAPPLDR